MNILMASVDDRLAKIQELLANRIYDLLSKGPLCSSQISNRLNGDELGDTLRTVESMLLRMQEEGLVQQKPDPRSKLWFPKAKQPWEICD